MARTTATRLANPSQPGEFFETTVTSYPTGIHTREIDSLLGQTKPDRWQDTTQAEDFHAVAAAPGGSDPDRVDVIQTSGTRVSAPREQIAQDFRAALGLSTAITAAEFTENLDAYIVWFA